MKEPKTIETGSSERIDIKDLAELWKIGFKGFNIEIIDEEVLEDDIQKKAKVSLPKEKDVEHGSVVMDFELDISSSS